MALARSDVVAHIRLTLEDKFHTKCESVYGIGSYFYSTFSVITPIDVVVLLSDTADCPQKTWTTALYDDEDWEGIKIRYLYAEFADYLDRERFERVSFSNYAWSIRALKHQSELLFGTDIRDRLPDVAYTPQDYEKICLNAMYHLENAISRSNNPDVARLYKGVFKSGFLILAIEEPDSDIHTIEMTGRKIIEYESAGIVSHTFAEIFASVLHRRTLNTPFLGFEDFVAFRKACVIALLDEIPRHVNITWPQFRQLLLRGFSGRGFTSLVLIGDEHNRYNPRTNTR